MRQFLLTLLIVHLAACSSMQAVNLRDVQPDSEHSAVQPGDEVELRTRDNETLKFAVTDVTAEGLAGRFGFIPYKDISSLKVRREGKMDEDTTAWILGLLGVAALVALFASADSSQVTVCSPSPCQP